MTKVLCMLEPIRGSCQSPDHTYLLILRPVLPVSNANINIIWKETSI